MFVFQKKLSQAFCAFLVLSTSYQCSSIGKRNKNYAKSNYTVENVEYLIYSEMGKASQYELPTSAKMYEPDDPVIRDFGTFDFIIIGAGSTGSVIASRLSEISKWKVLVLEAGTYPKDFTMIPGLFAIQALTEYNWGFVSTPQKTVCLGADENRCVVHRGKGIGGTSLINQLIYSRGNPIDYDRWAELLEDSSWRYENVLKFFKKSEDFHKTNPDAPLDWEYHGSGGYLYTHFHMPPSNFTKIFLQANREIGHNITDYNGKDELGATILQLNTKKGRRYDQGTAFIKPALGRRNLIISEKSYGIRIEVNNITKETTSVLFTKNNKSYRAKVNLEVILSAGTISSPQLLMLSGIGPMNHLKNLEIPVIQDLEVGSNLKDHVFCPISFSSNLSSPKAPFKQQVKDYVEGYGDLADGNPLDAAGWYKTNLGKIEGHPDIEIVPTYSKFSELGRRFLKWDQETWDDLATNKEAHPFGLSVVLLQTDSSGSVRLTSKNPYVYPDIDSNSLSDLKNKDINTLYEGIQVALDIINTPAFQKIGAEIQITPLKSCSKEKFLSKNFWYCYIRHLSIPAFHPVGTCSSGKDPNNGAVVDSNLKVFGIKKLRVADASVIPFTFSGHPNAICTLIGEKLSEIIRTDHQIYT